MDVVIRGGGRGRGQISLYSCPWDAAKVKIEEGKEDVKRSLWGRKLLGCKRAKAKFIEGLVPADVWLHMAHRELLERDVVAVEMLKAGEKVSWNPYGVWLPTSYLELGRELEIRPYKEVWEGFKERYNNGEWGEVDEGMWALVERVARKHNIRRWEGFAAYVARVSYLLDLYEGLPQWVDRVVTELLREDVDEVESIKERLKGLVEKYGKLIAYGGSGSTLRSWIDMGVLDLQLDGEGDSDHVPS